MKSVWSTMLIAAGLALSACGGGAEDKDTETNGPLPPIADEPLDELPPAESVHEAPIHAPEEKEPT